MSSVKEFISQQKYIILISILLFLGIYGLNHYFPITLDDWRYSTLADGSRVSSLWDIFEYQYDHYFTWGGRSIVHSIAQIMLAAGIFWGDVINSIGYVALVVVIYYIANKGNKINIPLFIGINLLIWFLIPALIENLFWITGSANYLWGTLIILSFLSFYCSAFITAQSKDGWIKKGALFLLGIIAGWTNENMAVAMIFFVICLMLLMIKERQQLPRWAVFGLIGAILGCAIMLLAPGNAIRNQSEIVNMSAEAEPIYMFYFYRFTSILKMASWHALIPSIIYVAFLLLYIKFKKKENNNRILYLSLLFAVTAGVATLVMIAAPIFPVRVWFAILIFLFIAIGLLYANLDFSHVYVKALLYTIIGFFTLAFFYSYWVSLSDFIRIHAIWAERDRIINIEKQKGNKDVVIYGRFKAADSWFVRPKTGDIPLDSIQWMQNAYGHYMGVNSVKIFDLEN